MHTLEPLADRLAFVRPPFNLENVAASADAFRADLLVLDYIQRIPPPGQHADKRGRRQRDDGLLAAVCRRRGCRAGGRRRRPDERQRRAERPIRATG